MFKHSIGLITCIAMLLVGCQLQKKDSLNEVVIDSSPDSFQAIEVTSPASTLSMTIRHMFTNNDVAVECFIPDFEFTAQEGEKGMKKGYLKVTVDHQKPYPVYKAAFIVKDLSKGNHHIGIELVNTNGQSFEGMKKQLFIQIR